MARYYQRPNNPIVDLTPKVPIEFYSNLINQAQQNLNQANVTGAAFMTDAHNQKFVDQAARDRAMALGQAPIEQALDRDFVTPAAIAKAVSQASAAMADWKNANAKHVELVKNYEEDKRRLGLNFLGTDPTKISLLKGDSFLTPEELKYTSMNAEDVYKTFGQTYGANLLGVTDNLVASDIPFKYKLEKIKGLSKEQKLQLLSPGTKDAVELAAGMMSTNPNLRQGLMDIYGTEEAAMKALQDLNLRASMDDKYAQTKDVSYIDNNWALWNAKKAATAKPPATNEPIIPVSGGVTKAAIGNNPTTLMSGVLGEQSKVDWDNLQFNEDGSISPTITSVIESTPHTFGTGMPTLSTTVKSEMKFKNKDYQQAKLELNKFAISLMRNTGDSRFSKMSDKELLQTLTEASNKTADYYGLSAYQIAPNVELRAGSSLIDETGKLRHDTSHNMEVRDADGNWRKVTHAELQKELGFDKQEDYLKSLKQGTGKIISFDSDEVKMLSGVPNADGTITTIRTKPANKHIDRAFEPFREVQQAIVTPGRHTIDINNIRFNVVTSPTYNENGEVIFTTKIISAKGSNPESQSIANEFMSAHPMDHARILNSYAYQFIKAYGANDSRPESKIFYNTKKEPAVDLNPDEYD